MGKRAELGTISTPEDEIAIGLEYVDGHRMLIGLPPGGVRLVISEDRYGPGNKGAVSAIAYLRARYAEPRYRLKVTAWWRDYAYLCEALARGCWHIAFHRSQFPIPPTQCAKCVGRR